MSRPFGGGDFLHLLHDLGMLARVTPTLMVSASAVTGSQGGEGRRENEVFHGCLLVAGGVLERSVLRLRLSKRRAIRSPALWTSLYSTMSTTTTTSITSGMKR